MNKKESFAGNIDRLLRNSGIDTDASEQLQKEALKDPAIAGALGRLTENDIAGIAAILNDKEAIARIMSTPKAQAIIRRLRK